MWFKYPEKGCMYIYLFIYLFIYDIIHKIIIYIFIYLYVYAHICISYVYIYIMYIYICIPPIKNIGFNKIHNTFYQGVLRGWSHAEPGN